MHLVDPSWVILLLPPEPVKHREVANDSTDDFVPDSEEETPATTVPHADAVEKTSSLE